jgi:hypothetical protein
MVMLCALECRRAASMTKPHDDDPDANAAASRDAAHDTTPDSTVTDPGPPPEHVNSDPDRSEIPPVDVMLQSIAQRRHIVPRSLEKGESYQGVHAPARPHPLRIEPPVVINVSTDPDLRHAEGSCLEPTVVLPRRRPSLVALLAAILSVGGIVIVVAVLRSAPAAPSASAIGTPDIVSSRSARPRSSATSPGPVLDRAAPSAGPPASLASAPTAESSFAPVRPQNSKRQVHPAATPTVGPPSVPSASPPPPRQDVIRSL